MPTKDGSIGDDCADSGGIGPGVAPDNEEGGESTSSTATTQSQTVTSSSTFIPNQPQHGPEESPPAPTVQGNATSEESHDADVDMRVDRTPRRARRSRRSLAAARRMQSAASIRAMVREKSRRGILVSLDASTGELELSLSHLAIDEGSGTMGGGIGDGETNTNAAPTTTNTSTSSRSHQQSRRGSHVSMASVESWMEEVRRLQEQGQVSDEMLASILAGEASAAADACGPTLDEWNDSTSSLSITDAVTEPCSSESGRPITGTLPFPSTNYSTKDEGLRYFYRREREMPKMKALTPLPDLQPIRAPPRGQEERKEAKDALARAAIKRVLAEIENIPIHQSSGFSLIGFT